MKCVHSLLLFCVAAAPSIALAADTEVSFRTKSATELEVLVGDAVFAVYNHGGSWNKPFVYPLYTARGLNVLREIIPTKNEQGSSKEGKDHFHHKGVWIAVDSVNDERLNFWHEEAKIICDSVAGTPGPDGTGRLTIHNSWMQGDKPLLKEHTTVDIYPDRLTVWNIRIEPVDRDVTFYDTKEGFFAVRVATSLREMQGGHIVNADGKQGEKQCWGQQSAWVDYYGEVDGQTCGVALMDHPDNFRPSRYHVRSYGLFAISPFGPRKYSGGTEPEAPVTLKPGQPGLHLTYGLFVHDGDTQAGKVAEAYQRFVKAARGAK